jgi:hypothetical protein
MYGKPTGKNKLGDIGVDGRIILQDRQSLYNVTLRRFLVTAFAGEKQ